MSIVTGYSLRPEERGLQYRVGDTGLIVTHHIDCACFACCDQRYEAQSEATKHTSTPDGAGNDRPTKGTSK